MRPLHGFFNLIVALVLLASPLGAGRAAEAADAFIVQPPSGNERAPSFTLPGLDGVPRALDEFAGDVVLLHFWASWCEPCKQEFPAIEELSFRFRGRGLSVIAVAEDSAERARAFVAEQGFSSIVVVDRWGKAKRDYGVMVIPYSVVIGRDGRIIGVISGPRDYSGPAAARYFEGVLGER